MNLAANGPGFTRRLQRWVVTPLVVLTLAVAGITAEGLWSNDRVLKEALRDQADAQRAWSLVLTQEAATQAILLDSSRVGEFSEQKLTAYDEHKELLVELAERARDPEVRRDLTDLARLDVEVLQPIDMLVLERLFVDEAAARRLYFETYRPTHVAYRERIRQILERTGAVAAAERASALRRNFSSLALVVGCMAVGALVVSAVIRVLGRRVERGQDELRSLMRGMDEGLFFFDATGRISAQRSQVLHQLLPRADGLETLAAFMVGCSSATAADVEACLALLWEDDADFYSPFEATVALLPQRVTASTPAGDRVLRLRYRAGRAADGTLERVYVSVVDVTEQLARERSALAVQERAERLCAAVGDPEGFLSSRGEIDRLFRQAIEALRADPPSVDVARRHLHTLKGVTGTAGFTGVSQAVHGLEDRLGPGGVVALAALHQRFLAEADDVGTVATAHLDEGTVRISTTRLRALREALQWTHPAMAEAVDALDRRPLDHFLGRHRQFVAAHGDRRGITRPLLLADPRASEVTREEFERVDPLLGHLLRNALDHAIEDADERARAGKPRIGTLRIQCRRSKGNALEWSVSDDGRGIDGDVLARKMVALGRWTPETLARATPSEKVELARLPDLSSREDVTETSGRGLGVHAVDAAMVALGGRLTLASTPGVGTRVVLAFPATTPSRAGNGAIRAVAVPCGEPS